MEFRLKCAPFLYSECHNRASFVVITPVSKFSLNLDANYTRYYNQYEAFCNFFRDYDVGMIFRQFWGAARNALKFIIYTKRTIIGIELLLWMPQKT